MGYLSIYYSRLPGRIEDNVIVGAGTIVLDSIKKNSVVVGTKGKIIKKGGTMEKYEIVKSYDDFKSRLEALDKVLNINNMKQEVIQNEVVMSSANFWDDNKKATLFLQNHTSLKEIIQSFESIRSDIEELEQYNDIELVSSFSSTEVSCPELKNAKIESDIEKK